MRLSILDAALFRALHSTSGARDRWNALAATRPTDEEIARQIAAEFEVSGGFTTPEGLPCHYAGGINPRFWCSPERYPGRASLEGPALVNAARRLLGIPQTGGGPVQTEMFG